MKEDSEEMVPAGYDGKGIRGWGWALFGVATAAAAKYVMGNGGLLGNGTPPSGDPPWARDMNYERELTKANAEIGQLKAEQFANTAVLAAERRLADKIEAIEKSMAATTMAQQHLNDVTAGFVASVQEKANLLMGMTGLVIKAPALLASEGAASAFKTTGATASPAASNGGTGN